MSENTSIQTRNSSYWAFLNAGMELILTRGYDAVTIADIARLADYGRSTFYLHFQDKEDLVWALLRSNAIAIDQQIAERTQGMTSPEREWHSWRIICAEVDRARPFFLQMDGELSRRLRQWQKDHLISTLEQELKSGFYHFLPDTPPEVAARQVVGALLETLEYWLRHPEAGDADTIAAHMFRLVFHQDPPEA